MIIKNKFNVTKLEETTSEVVLITKSYLKVDIISWVDHYLNWCGFDHVTIIDNESLCGSLYDLFENNDKVTVIDIYDKDKSNFFQQTLYNKFIRENEKYTYQFFCDDDEYLWFDKTKYNTINNYLSNLNNRNIYAFAIPMINISYKSGDVPDKRTKAMINDCFYVNENYNTTYEKYTYKSFIHLNLAKLHPQVCFGIPHFIANYFTLLADNRFVNPQVFDDYFIATNPSELDIKLFHYHHRSYKEWEDKMNRNRIDMPVNTTYKLSPTQGIIEYPKNYYTYYLNPFNLS